MKDYSALAYKETDEMDNFSSLNLEKFDKKNVHVSMYNGDFYTGRLSAREFNPIFSVGTTNNLMRRDILTIREV